MKLATYGGVGFLCRFAHDALKYPVCAQKDV